MKKTVPIYSYNKRFKRPSLSTHDRLLVIARDGLFCSECRTMLFLNEKSITPYIKNGAFHHIVPLVYGGENSSNNICLLCKQCHIKTHAGRESRLKYYKMHEMFILKGFLTEEGRCNE